MKNNTIRLPRRMKKNDKIHVLSILLLMTIFFNMNNYQDPSEKTEKISQYSEGSAPSSCFGTGLATVLSTPPRKMEYAGVLQHRSSRDLGLCSVCPE